MRRVQQEERDEATNDDKLSDDLSEEEIDEGASLVEAGATDAALLGPDSRDEEGHPARARPIPSLPTMQEIEEPELTHIPYGLVCALQTRPR